jgi:hypothetical protein
MRDLNAERFKKICVYGTLIAFTEPEPLLKAAREAYALGYRQLDAYTPYPVEELAELIGFKKDRVALVTLVGGLAGGIIAFAMQVYCNVVDYPINVGGRPYYSWPAFIPVTFELTVLGAALSAAAGMLIFNKLPKLWHPLFNSPEFLQASKDRFFLCIMANDAKYNVQNIKDSFQQFNPETFSEVNFEE